MMARWIGFALLSASLFGSGCCCTPCGPCGQPTCCFSLPCIPKPIVWDGGCNDCGPNSCTSCAGYGNHGCQTCGIFGNGGLFPGLGSCMSCGKGCSDIYIHEWISDPPDCCDPCDQCQGQFTGPHGYCCRGPFQRILSAFHCYKYCPAPYCGPWRPIFGHCGCGGGSGAMGCCDAGPSCGCGGVGCSTCAGGGPAGGEVYYEGAPGQAVPRPTPSTRIQQGAPTPGETTIIEESVEAPRMRPAVGGRVQSVQPSRNQGQISGRYSPQEIQQMQVAQKQAQRQQIQTASRQQVAQQPQRLTAAQVAARRAALQKRAEAAEAEEDVRGATYQR
ncbi:MAG TPA: hypothetical protein VGI40_16035 [Pirellulaceae bacterium]